MKLVSEAFDCGAFHFFAELTLERLWVRVWIIAATCDLFWAVCFVCDRRKGAMVLGVASENRWAVGCVC